MSSISTSSSFSEDWNSVAGSVAIFSRREKPSKNAKSRNYEVECSSRTWSCYTHVSAQLISTNGSPLNSTNRLSTYRGELYGRSRCVLWYRYEVSQHHLHLRSVNLTPLLTGRSHLQQPGLWDVPVLLGFYAFSHLLVRDHVCWFPCPSVASFGGNLPAIESVIVRLSCAGLCRYCY